MMMICCYLFIEVFFFYLEGKDDLERGNIVYINGKLQREMKKKNKASKHHYINER